MRSLIFCVLILAAIALGARRINTDSEITVVVRVFKPISDLHPNLVVWEKFRDDFESAARQVLKLSTTRFKALNMMEGNEVSLTTKQYEESSRRRTPGLSYAGTTLLIFLKIQPGMPVSTDVFKDIQKLVADPTSQWYAEDSATRVTDPGFPPTVLEDDSKPPAEIIPNSMILPIGITPLVLMLGGYIALLRKSKFVNDDKFDPDEGVATDPKPPDTASPADKTGESKTDVETKD